MRNKTVEANGTIFDSICKNGLMSARDVIERVGFCHSASNVFDGNVVLGPLEKICGVFFFEPQPADVHPNLSSIRSPLVIEVPQLNTSLYPELEETSTETVVRFAFFHGPSSIFPILAERRGDEINEIPYLHREKISRRICASALVAVPAGVIKLNRGVDGLEAETESPLVLPQTSVVFAPERHFGEVKKRFGQKAVRVSLTKHVMWPYSKEAKQVTGPDYPSHVIKMARERQTPLFLHAVRLFTDGDMRRNSH